MKNITIQIIVELLVNSVYLTWPPRSIKTDTGCGPFSDGKRGKNGLFTAVYGVKTDRFRSVLLRMSGSSCTARILSVSYTVRIWQFFHILQIEYGQPYCTVLLQYTSVKTPYFVWFTVTFFYFLSQPIVFIVACCLLGSNIVSFSSYLLIYFRICVARLKI